MINDADRRKLHSALLEALGPEPSGLLMELLPPTGWANLATQQDISIVRADIDIVRSDIDIAKTELRIEIQDLRTELKSDIQEVANMLPKLIAANIASMIGTAGLVLAAVSVG